MPWLNGSPFNAFSPWSIQRAPRQGQTYTDAPPLVTAAGYPPYPRLPTAGSNATGVAVVGVSSTGDLPLLTLWDVVISQYANSPILTAWMSAWFSTIDPTEFFDLFFDNMWNMDTNWGYGLDVWGRIVGGLSFTRTIQVVVPVPYFSFDDPELGFDTPGADIYAPGDPLTEIAPQALQDTDWRRLIMARAAGNISNGSISSVLFAYNTFFSWYGSQVFINETNTQYASMDYMLCVSGSPISLLELTILTDDLITQSSTGTNMEILVASAPGGPIFGFDRDDSVVGGFDHGVIGVTPSQYIALSQ